MSMIMENTDGACPQARALAAVILRLIEDDQLSPQELRSNLLTCCETALRPMYEMLRLQAEVVYRESRTQPERVQVKHA